MTRLMTLAMISTLLIMHGCKKEDGGAGSGGGAETTPPKAITIEANDAMQFNVNAFDAKPGQKVKFTLKNVGKLPKAAMGHNWVLLKKGIGAVAFGGEVASGKGGASLATDWLPTQDPQKSQMLAHTKLLGPGESDTIEFTAPTEPGAYEYLCMFPGHFALMKGIMTVK